MSKSYNALFPTRRTRMPPRIWDVVAFSFVLGMLGMFVWAGKQMVVPYELGQNIPCSLSPSHLPGYALLTVLRLFIAMSFALLFTFTIGTLAAKNERAASVIIPCIDILQSVPVIGLLSIAVVGFIKLFHGNRLGPEAAAIFAIFTAQVWNITLSFYQSLRSVPIELKEAADMFHLSSWQRFWRVEVPFSIPGLLWNMMLSMSGSWIFLIAAESIVVNKQTILLPGIGSYLRLAISQASIPGVVYTLLTMLIVIFLYDQLFFRPLLNWSQKFTFEHTSRTYVERSWITTLLQRSSLFAYCTGRLRRLSDLCITLPFLKYQPILKKRKRVSTSITPSITWYASMAMSVVVSLYLLIRFIGLHVSLSEIPHVVLLGLITATRVILVTLICSIIWVPIGVFIGLNRRIARIAQPIAQFLAAFPANVLFPIVVIIILKYHLNVNIWTTPLMLLGTQWYILFNVIAGASALPEDLKQVSANFCVRGWQWWRRFVLPCIFPYWITGTITAVGNCWNTSIIAEVVAWGPTTLTAMGLGAYIVQQATAGDPPRVALGIAIMSLFVLLMNYVIWRPLYNLARTRYKLD